VWSCLPVNLLAQSMCFGEKARELDFLIDHRYRHLQPTRFVVRLSRRHQRIVLHTSRSQPGGPDLL
jgi:hypothetical protein